MYRLDIVLQGKYSCVCAKKIIQPKDNLHYNLKLLNIQEVYHSINYHNMFHIHKNHTHLDNISDGQFEDKIHITKNSAQDYPMDQISASFSDISEDIKHMYFMIFALSY
jgi:hypothetical protein